MALLSKPQVRTVSIVQYCVHFTGLYRCCTVLCALWGLVRMGRRTQRHADNLRRLVALLSKPQVRTVMRCTVL